MKNARKYFIFPITYLILELAEDFIIYKCSKIDDIYIRTAVIMGALVAGISILAFILMPFFEGGLERLHKSHKKHGPLADFVVSCSMIIALYGIYYLKFKSGLEAILPPFLLN